MSNTIEVMAQWLSGLWCWIYHVCLGFKSFEWQNILHLDCHGLDWIPFEILRSKNKGWIDPMGLTFSRMDQSNELQFLHWFHQPCLAHSISTVWCSAMMPVTSSRSRLRKARLSTPSGKLSRTKRDLHLITFPQTHSLP